MKACGRDTGDGGRHRQQGDGFGLCVTMERQCLACAKISDGLALVGEEARRFYLRIGKHRAVRMVEAAAERAGKQQDGVVLRCVPERELRVREIFFDWVTLDVSRMRFSPCPVVICRAVGIAEQDGGRKVETAACRDATVDSDDRCVLLQGEHFSCPSIGRHAPSEKEHACRVWQRLMKIERHLRQFDGMVCHDGCSLFFGLRCMV